MPCMPGPCCPPHVHALAARPGLPVSGSGTPGATQSVPCMLLWLRLHPVPCGTLEGPLPMPWALGQAEQDHSSWPGKPWCWPRPGAPPLAPRGFQRQHSVAQVMSPGDPAPVKCLPGTAPGWPCPPSWSCD